MEGGAEARLRASPPAGRREPAAASRPPRATRRQPAAAGSEWQDDRRSSSRLRAVPTTHRHPVFGRIYPRIARAAEARGGAEHRRRLLAGLSGQVLEVGAGDGLNYGYYPAEVTRLVAVEPEPRMRALAEQAAVKAAIAIEVRPGRAEALPGQDGEFDAAVASLVLCSVSDQLTALREVARVLKPGGELRFYEHVRSSEPGRALLQRMLDATVYPSLAGGCHCARDTPAAIRAAGYEIEKLEVVSIRGERMVPTVPHVVGIARSRGSASDEGGRRLDD